MSKGEEKKERNLGGRPRRCFPYDVARELVRKENLGSVRQYHEWYKYNKPARIPKRPDRAYHKNFVSWNDFLGNDNEFGVGQYRYKTYEEAKRFARTLDLKTQTDWIKYDKEIGLPDDIPTRPDLFYQKTYEWYTWAEFLGSSAKTRIDEAQNTERVIYIVRYDVTPNNVYHVGVVKSESDVYTNQGEMGFDIIKLYRCNKSFPLEDVIHGMGLAEYGGEYPNMYIISNFFDFTHALEEAGTLIDISI